MLMRTSRLVALALALAWCAIAAPSFAVTITPPSSEALARLAKDPRVDAKLVHMLEHGKPFPEIVRGQDANPSLQSQVTLMVRGNVDAAALTAAGARIETQAGPVTTIVTPLANVPALLALPNLETLSAPRTLQPLLSKSIVDIGATAMSSPSMATWQGVYPNVTGYTGKRVVVGIVDTGIDLSTIDFRTTSGQTRVKFLWDMNAYLGTPPVPYGYGVEYTDIQINAGACPETDTDGHGTHMAGAAASNGRATGQGYPAYRYTGVAPDADIVVVKLQGSAVSETAIINGVNYIMQKATLLGEDCVVVVAWGDNYGGHDGSYNLDAALSALTGPGHIVVAAAGNDGTHPIHALANVTSGQTATVNFTIPTFTPSGYNEMVDVDFWHSATAAFNVRLTSPGGRTSGWITPGSPAATTYDTPDGSFQVANDVTTNSKGGKQIGLWIFDHGDGIVPKSGTWKVELQRVSTATSGVVEGWVSGFRLVSGGVSPAFTSSIDYTDLVQSPASADSIISAGAYVTRVGWRDMYGDSTYFMDSPQLGRLASFSSAGPRRDGAVRPDVAAPGEAVAATLSSAAQISSLWKSDDGAHYVSEGTSAAAAHVAGSIALLLQKTPHLSPSAVRRALINNARHDSFTGSGITPGWGNGKLFLGPANTASVGMTGSAAATLEFDPPYPNPAHGDVTFEFVLSTQDLTHQPVVRLRIFDVSGREIATMQGQSVAGRQRLVWNGLLPNGRSVGSGVFMGRLEVGGRTLVRRFVRVS